MVDHHVDRPGVEARRRVELTGTNRSIGLIVLIKAYEHLCSANDVFTIRFADLVAMPRSPHPIPSRTRSLSSSGPMVLRLKARESRSPPGLPNGSNHHNQSPSISRSQRRTSNPLRSIAIAAGWSSPVARQAHNLKVTGSNPVPAPKFLTRREIRRSPLRKDEGFVLCEDLELVLAPDIPPMGARSWARGVSLSMPAVGMSGRRGGGS